MPIKVWSYTFDPDTRHIGPTAQDFQRLFGLGSDDKHIAAVDADGVALTAIQGLHQMVKARDVEIQELKQAVAELRSLVRDLARKTDQDR